MTSDAKTIAIYKTIGYENNTIRGLYTKFYFVTTTIAVWIGVLCSKPLSNWILDDLFSNIGEQASIEVGKIGLVIYAIILLLVLGTVYLVTMQMKKNETGTCIGEYQSNKCYKKENV